MLNTQELQDFTTQVRRDILRMVHRVNSGHPGGSLGCAEFFVCLFNNIIERKPGFEMDGIGEDLFFLSNGHISPVYYSVLARVGYFPVDELNTFRHINSRLQGHPTTHEGLPGVRIASGSLGQGMSVAIGAAQSKKLNKDGKLIYSLHGDGELQEGQIWEAMMYAAAKGIDNWIATVDLNGKQIDGNTSDVLDLGDVKSKFIAFGWDVVEIENGNDVDAILDDGLLPVFFLMSDTHRSVVTERDIVTDGYCPEKHPSVMPDPHPPSELDRVLEVDPEETTHEPMQYLVEQTERQPKQARPNVHSQISKAVNSDCPEARRRELPIVGVEVLAEESPKADALGVLIAVSRGRVLTDS